MMQSASLGAWLGSHVNVSASTSGDASNEPSDASDAAASSLTALDELCAKISPPSLDVSSFGAGLSEPALAGVLDDGEPPHLQRAAVRKARTAMPRTPSDPSPQKCAPNISFFLRWCIELPIGEPRRWLPGIASSASELHGAQISDRCDPII